MKQHITPEQLQELSPEAKKSLELWCFEKRYFTRHPVPGEPARFSTTDTYESFMVDPPLISIGQMIEFLGQDNWGMVRDALEDKGSDGFCDALWETVKDKLSEMGE